MRDWNLQWDMNSDGHFTISDIWLSAKSVFYYPGDYLIKLAIDTKIGIFFEISNDDYGGFLSGILSFFIWCFALLVFKVISDGLEALGNKIWERIDRLRS